MIVGIDLGTTNSLISVWSDGKPRLLPNALGEVLTPSCVSVDDDGSLLVGRAARERASTHPELTARSFKRFMGSAKTIKLGKHVFRPEELSALVLRSLKADAEAALGAPVHDAIVTVPAYFSDAQRKATRAAGQLAGLNIVGLLNEPTAASLAYGIHQLGAETRFLVFDLGGGTFDISILEMFEGVMEVRASAGDNFLGGDDFVEALCERFIAHCELSPNLRRDPSFMQRLAVQGEGAKRRVSAERSAMMAIEHQGRQYSMEVTEELLADACAPLLKRLRAPVERAMRDANLRTTQLDNVVLAGGATRMPIVRKLATSMFGRFPAVNFNPDEVVAMGAAVQAGLKARDAALSEVVMTDVAPYSLGVAVSRQMSPTVTTHGHFDPIIERNSPVPISRVKTYVPTDRGQSRVDLSIFQGEARMVADNIHLGNLTIVLPPQEKEENPVDVRFTYDVDGLLQVEATVQKTGDKFSCLIEGKPGLMSEDEIRRKLQELSALKIHPRDLLENRTTLARAERMYQQLRGDVREWLRQQIIGFEAALATQDKRTASAARTRLDEQLDAIEKDTDLFTMQTGGPEGGT